MKGQHVGKFSLNASARMLRLSCSAVVLLPFLLSATPLNNEGTSVEWIYPSKSDGAGLWFSGIPLRKREFLPGSGVSEASLSSANETLVAYGDGAFGGAGNRISPALLRRLASLERLRGAAKGKGAAFRQDILHANLYGGIYSYAYYYTSILVGTPPQRQSVIVDSGSSLLGFPCRTCLRCGHSHIDAGFDVSRSSTARWLDCAKDTCYGECVAASALGLGSGHNSKQQLCRYHQSYSEGSSIDGNYFSDLITLGESGDGNAPVRYDYTGCHDQETNLFRTQKASGIMGISYPKFGKQPTLMDVIFGTSIVRNHAFALCASEEGGVLTVGGFNASLHKPGRTHGSGNLRILGESQRLRLAWSGAEEEREGDADFGGHSAAAPLRGLKRVEADEGGADPFETLQLLKLSQREPMSRDINNQRRRLASFGKKFTTPEPLAQTIAWTPIVSQTNYQVEIQSISYVQHQRDSADRSGTPLATAQDTGTGLVDSGTTFTYFAPKAYERVMPVLKEACQRRSSAASSGSSSPSPPYCSTTSDNSLCWIINSPKQFEELPSFLFYLRGGAVVEWPAASYLHQRAKTNQWCLALDKNNSPTTILGMSFMKGKNVIFDRERNLIGFQDADCPYIDDDSRPPPPTPPPIKESASLHDNVPPVAGDFITPKIPREGQLPDTEDRRTSKVDRRDFVPIVTQGQINIPITTGGLIPTFRTTTTSRHRATFEAGTPHIVLASVAFVSLVGLAAVGTLKLRSLYSRRAAYEQMPRPDESDLELGRRSSSPDEAPSPMLNRSSSLQEQQYSAIEAELEALERETQLAALQGRG